MKVSYNHCWIMPLKNLEDGDMNSTIVVVGNDGYNIAHVKKAESKINIRIIIWEKDYYE